MPMMVPMAPSVPAGAENGVFALLALIADPAGCQARLEELQAIANEASAAVSAQQDLKAELDARSIAIRTSEESIADRSAALDGREASANQREAAIGAAEVSISETRAALEQEESNRVADWNTREEALRGREQSLAIAQAKAETDAAAAEELRLEYEKKLADLRRVMG